MKNATIKKIATILSAALLLLTNPVFATEEDFVFTPELKPETIQALQPAVEDKTDEKIAEQQEKILTEAYEAIAESRNALIALYDGKIDETTKALELVTGKIAFIVARNPELTLAMVDLNVQVYDFFSKAETIEATVKQAIKYLKDGEVQLARQLVESMASEIVIESINIPLGTYPEAIMDVVLLIDEGKIEEAKGSLQEALGALVVVKEVVIPLPIVRAKFILKGAEELAKKNERTEEDKNQLEELLNEVKTQLKIAEILGYGDKKEFKPMYEHLKIIREKTKEGKSGKGYFDKIKVQLAKIFK